MKFLSSEVAFMRFIFLTMSYSLSLIIVAISGLVLLGLLILHLLLLLNPFPVVDWNAASLSFFCGYYFDKCSYLDWLTWFHFFILAGDALIIQIGCMIFLSTFLDIIKISIETIYFFIMVDCKILNLQNAFIWPMI